MWKGRETQYYVNINMTNVSNTNCTIIVTNCTFSLALRLEGVYILSVCVCVCMSIVYIVHSDGFSAGIQLVNCLH